MFKIVICDDQPEIVNLIKKYIDTLLAGEEYSLRTFTDGKEMLLADIEDTDLFLLDIVMPEMDGFEVAQRINAKLPKTRIIFLTAESNKVFDGYKYRAYRFVLKGDEEALKEGVLSAVRLKTGEKITVDIKNEFNEKEQVTINKEHIIYFECNLRKLTMVTLKGKYNVAGDKLSDFIERFTPLGFVCVHRSYLVNMSHIGCFDKNDVVLSNGERINIGSKKSMVKQVKQQYFRFLEED